MLVILNSIRYEERLSFEKLGTCVLCHLHPTFSSEYKPCITKGDGNCIWNSISLTFCGNESLSSGLRWLTVISLLVFKKDFVTLLDKKYEHTSVSDFKSYARVKYKTFLKFFKISMTDFKYGDENHILALSTILSRDIFIYNYFIKTVD